MTGSLGAVAAAVGIVLKLSGEAISDSQSDPSVATTALTVAADGTVSKTESVTTTQIGAATDWIVPNGAASSAFEVRRTSTTGDAPTGPAEDTWVDLGSDRTWQLEQSGVGSKSCSMTVQIRVGGVVIASGSYSFSATVN